MVTKVIDIDLAKGPNDIDILSRYRSAMVLIRWRDQPVGRLWLEIVDGRVSREDLWHEAINILGDKLVKAALEEMISVSSQSLKIKSSPSCTLAVCTRNRIEHLRRCIDSLCSYASPESEIMIVDNDPSDDKAYRLASEYHVRYVREDFRGLNWARSRGARVAKNEIVIYVDDDVEIEQGYVDAMLEPFANPFVAGVTGLVLPAELETEPQEFFERNCLGLGRGFERREYTKRINQLWQIGAGASMAFRRTLINRHRIFDSEMDAGTSALSGGDTYAFYLLLNLGYHLVYTPKAVSWHRHRSEWDDLYHTLFTYEVGSWVAIWRYIILKRDTSAIFEGYERLQIALKELIDKLRAGPPYSHINLTLGKFTAPILASRAYILSRRQEQLKIQNLSNHYLDIDSSSEKLFDI